MDLIELILPTIETKLKLLPTGFTQDYYCAHFMTLEEGKNTSRNTHPIFLSLCSPLLSLLKALIHPQCSVPPSF